MVGIIYLSALHLVGFVLPVRIHLLMIPWLAVYWLPLVDVLVGGMRWTVTVLDVIMVSIWVKSLVGLMRLRKITRPLLMLAILPFVLTTSSALGAAATIGIGRVPASVMVLLKRWSAYSILPVAARMALKEADLARVQRNVLLAYATALFYSVFVSCTALDGSRAIGVFFNPNILGNVSVICIALCLPFLGARLSRAHLGYLALVLLAIVAMVISGSREAAVSGACVITWWLARVCRGKGPTERLRSALWLSVLVCLFVVSNVLGIGSLGDRWQTAGDSLLDRLDMQRIGIHMAADHPLGIGADNIGILGHTYLVEHASREYNWYVFQSGLTTTDNVYVNTLIETGLIGLLALVTTVWLMGRQLRRSTGYFGLVGFAVLMAACVSSLAAQTLFSPFVSVPIWYLFACSEVERKYGLAHD